MLLFVGESHRTTCKDETTPKDKGKDKNNEPELEDEPLISLAQFGFELFDNNEENLVQPQVCTRKRKQPDTLSGNRGVHPPIYR